MRRQPNHAIHLPTTASRCLQNFGETGLTSHHASSDDGTAEDLHAPMRLETIQGAGNAWRMPVALGQPIFALRRAH